jgi:Uma2 family endonuclease
MTVDEFLVWAEGREGRWELYNGVPYAMSPERTRHIKVKYAVQTALLQSIRRAGVQCHMLADGAGIRISQHVMHIPDALVYCGAELADDAIEVKLKGYFSLPSLHHYLIVDPDGPPVIHHRCQADGPILTSIVHDGTLSLAPPSIEVGIAEMFAP